MVLQQHILPRRKKTEDATEYGTLVHHWKETGSTRRVGTDKKHTDTLERKLFRSGTERERWWDERSGEHEFTFAFNPFTLQLVVYRGERGGADHWKKRFSQLMLWLRKRDEWVTGTIDWLGRRGGRRWVDDLKTGAFPVDVTTSKQVRTYAVVPWLLDGMPDEWACDVSITQWAQYPLDGEPTREWDVLNTFDILEHLQDLRWVLSHPGEVRPVSYGPPQPDENGRYKFGEKLPVCAGCECREPYPMSRLLSNFWYRTLPHCTPGMLKRANG